MIKIENVETYGWEAAIRGMRNPKNSWEKSDTIFDGDKWCIGDNDLKLMTSLAAAGTDHGKFLRMITVTLDITAPLYWWKEFDTYKVGTVANSCSTMHKLTAKEFELDDFSHEHLIVASLNSLKRTIEDLNSCREAYLSGENKDPEWKKEIWWQLIQLLPSSYNQRRTVQLNYAVLKNMYHARKNHKLDEWINFCGWTETLPYAELITGRVGGNDDD